MSGQLSIEQVLPHEGRMLLLDELLEYGPEQVVCGVAIKADSVFCGSDGLPAWVGLEYMAQTACAYSGIEEVQAGRKPSIALLLGARRYRSNVAHFAIGARLRVVANLLMRDESGLVAFDCAIWQGDEVLARGDVKAIRPHDLGAIIRGERLEQ